MHGVGPRREILSIKTGKQERESICAGFSLQPLTVNMALPFIIITMGNLPVKTLINSGCQQSVIARELVETLGLHIKRQWQTVSMLNGTTTRSCGEVSLTVHVTNGKHSQNEMSSCTRTSMWLWIDTGS